MYSEQELKAMGFSASDLENFDEGNPESFDPTGGVMSEGNPHGRGVFNGQKGKKAVFSIVVKNRTSSAKYVELFNSERSILKVPNSSWYLQNTTNHQYAPLTAGKLRNLISVIATRAAYADANDVNTDACAIANDFNGDLIFLPTADQTAINANNIGPDSDVTGVDVFVKCAQVPYVSLLEDIGSGLVLHIVKMRIRTSNIDQFDNEISMNRWKSFGGSESNTLEYATYRGPENNLTDTVDVKESFYVDKKTGLFLRVEETTQMNINFTVIAFRNNGVAWK